MTTNKRYRLLKRLEDPCGSIAAGVIKDEHQWMARFALLNTGDCEIKKDWFEPVIETPQPKERIEVTHLLYREKHSDGDVYEIKFNRILQKGDGERIKQAIERVLNDKPFSVDKIYEYCKNEFMASEREEKAFNAARETTDGRGNYACKYPTFQDYKQASLKEDKK